jgi:hypothetical protein
MKRSIYKNKKITILVLLSILFLGAFLRLYGLRYNPFWHGDEGDAVEWSKNLTIGEARVFGMPLIFFPRLPLFTLLSAFFVKLLGVDILSLRILCALTGILTIYVVFLAGKEYADDISLGLLSAFLLSIFPIAVATNRMVFGYNIVLLLNLLNFLFLIRYINESKAKWLCLACLAAGLSLITEPFGIAAVLLTFLYVIFKEGRFLLKATLLTMLPFFISAFFIRIFIDKFFFNDMKMFLIERFYSTNYNIREGSFLDTITLIPNFMSYYGYWTLLGVIGVFISSPGFKDQAGSAEKKSVLLFATFSMVIFLIVGWQRDGSFFSRTFIMVAGFIVLGLANFIIYFYRYIKNRFTGALDGITSKKFPNFPCHLNAKIITYSSFGLLAFLFLGIIYFDIFCTLTRFRTPLDFISVRSSNAARKAAEFINKNTEKSDLVLVSPHYAWLINNCKVSELLQSVILEKKDTRMFKYKRWKDRFFYNCSYKDAKYIVVDRHIIYWTYLEPAIYDIVEEIMRSWYPVFKARSSSNNTEYIVYMNPCMTKKNQEPNIEAVTYEDSVNLSPFDKGWPVSFAESKPDF